MLTFFRKIRKSLLGSGATGMYLLYAIGEIALVVIGILIALQINNWNEWRRERAYEDKMLTEINSSIDMDIHELEDMISLCQFLREDVEEGLRIIHASQVNEDSLADILGSNIPLDISFQYAAFESLKAQGINYLTNDSIRLGLVRLYDQSYKEVEQSFDSYNQQMGRDWLPYLKEFTRIVNWNNGLLNYPLDINQILGDHRIENWFELKWFLMNLYSSNMQETIDECRRISDMISRELEDLDG